MSTMLLKETGNASLGGFKARYKTEIITKYTIISKKVNMKKPKKLISFYTFHKLNNNHTRFKVKWGFKGLIWSYFHFSAFCHILRKKCSHFTYSFFFQVEGYKGRAVVVVSCVTTEPPHRPHPHSLVGKEGCKKGVCTLEIPPDTMTLSFQSLGVQCVKKKEIDEALVLRQQIRVDPFQSKLITLALKLQSLSAQLLIDIINMQGKIRSWKPAKSAVKYSKDCFLPADCKFSDTQKRILQFDGIFSLQFVQMVSCVRSKKHCWQWFDLVSLPWPYPSTL